LKELKSWNSRRQGIYFQYSQPFLHYADKSWAFAGIWPCCSFSLAVIQLNERIFFFGYEKGIEMEAQNRAELIMKDDRWLILRRYCSTRDLKLV
jgi:hypothetical protein